jgi:hypothetical protein
MARCSWARLHLRTYRCMHVYVTKRMLRWANRTDGPHDTMGALICIRWTPCRPHTSAAHMNLPTIYAAQVKACGREKLCWETAGKLCRKWPRLEHKPKTNCLCMLLHGMVQSLDPGSTGRTAIITSHKLTPHPVLSDRLVSHVWECAATSRALLAHPPSLPTWQLNRSALTVLKSLSTPAEQARVL